MVERRVCTFCGDEIEPGTGRMYIKKDGVVFNFCSSKCFKNLVILGRVPRRTTWTQYYAREKEVRMKGGPAPAEAPKAKKVRKVTEKAEEEPKKAEAKPKDQKAPEEAKPKAAEKKPAPKEAPKKTPEKKAGEPRKEKPRPKPEQKPKPAEEGKK